jgi:hypothetical protein
MKLGLGLGLKYAAARSRVGAYVPPPADVTAPTITSPNSSSAVEGIAVDGTVTANEPASFSITGTDAAFVTINAGTGVWSIPTPDYETKTSYSWTFRATDGAGNIGTQAYTHSVTNDVADDPIVIGTIADLAATPATSTTVDLAFTPATNATGHEYRIGNGAPVSCENDGTQSVSGLTASTAYNFQVRGLIGSNEGAWSNVASATTQAESGTTLDPELPTPALTSNSPAFPVVFDATIGGGAYEGEFLEFQADSSYSDLIAGNAERQPALVPVGGGNADLGLSTIMAPAQTYARIRLVVGTTHSAWSPVSGHNVELAALTADDLSVPEHSAIGTVVGNITNKKDGSVLTMTDTNGGRFTIDGTAIKVAGDIDADDGTASYPVTISEDLPGAPGSPFSTTLAIVATNVDDVPTLTNGTFTDVTGVALSSSHAFSYTVAGLAAEVNFSSTFPVTKNGTGSFTSGRVVNGDVLAGTVTASGSYSTAVDQVLVVGEGSDTFTVTTLADPNAVPEMTQVSASAPGLIQTSVKSFGTLNLGAEHPTRHIYIGVGFTSGGGQVITGATLGGESMVIVSGGAGGAQFLRIAKPTGTSAELIVTFSDANSHSGGVVVWRYVSGAAVPTHTSGNDYGYTGFPRSVAATTPANGFTLAVCYAESPGVVATVTNAIKQVQNSSDVVTIVGAMRTGASSANVIFSDLSGGNAQTSISVGP